VGRETELEHLLYPPNLTEYNTNGSSVMRRKSDFKSVRRRIARDRKSGNVELRAKLRQLEAEEENDKREITELSGTRIA